MHSQIVGGIKTERRRRARYGPLVQRGSLWRCTVTRKEKLLLYDRGEGRGEGPIMVRPQY